MEAVTLLSIQHYGVSLGSWIPCVMDCVHTKFITEALIPSGAVSEYAASKEFFKVWREIQKEKEKDQPRILNPYELIFQM